MSPDVEAVFTLALIFVILKALGALKLATPVPDVRSVFSSEQAIIIS